jgi:hypothetical protein
LVTWKVPGRRAAARRRIATAKSAVNEGQPRWSSTNASEGRSASDSTVLTMLWPCSPHTHDVRTIDEPGASAATSCSPPSFDRP